ncbi:MAG: DNRLRE domain-containing protein, partial [Actinomycetota bacterium]|nr:DNRLRE domain-containing protein [Actinomycetota bacterium]
MGITLVAVPSAASATTTAHTLVFGATDDSYTSAAAPTSNYGSSTVLSSGSAVGSRQVTYLKFNVSGLPATMASITATLRLTRTAHHLPATVSANSVPGTAWTESTLTRTNEPRLGASIGTVTATRATSLVAFTTGVATNGVYAFAVTTPVTTDTARFNSSESAGAHPTLTVNYAVASTPPSPPPPPPPASSGVWVGAAANVPNATVTTFDAQNALIGPLKVRRSFNTTLPATFAQSSGGQDAAHGYRSFVSWKPPGGDFVGAANGTYDA